MFTSEQLRDGLEAWIQLTDEEQNHLIMESYNDIQISPLRPLFYIKQHPRVNYTQKPTQKRTPGIVRDLFWNDPSSVWSREELDITCTNCGEIFGSHSGVLCPDDGDDNDESDKTKFSPEIK